MRRRRAFPSVCNGWGLGTPETQDRRDLSGASGAAASLQARSSRGFHPGVIERTPDIALAEIAEQLQADRGVRAAPATIWSFLDKRRLTFKKTAHASEQERDDIRAARALWFEWRRAHDPDRLVFIDETGVSTKMARLRGRALRGKRCRAAVPHGHWKTTTFTAALRHSGLAALMVLDGPMNGIAFLAYVRQVLVPELRLGDIVMTATSFVRAGTTSPATR